MYTTNIQRLAIFAGAGTLPTIAVKKARARGLSFVLYHIIEAELDTQLVNDTALVKREISLGGIQQTFAYLKEDEISHIILLGKIEKKKMLHDIALDTQAEAIYNSVVDRRDDTLFHKFAELIAQAGITILEQRELLEGCFLNPGVHTRLKPERAELVADIEFAYELSRKIGSLDIGQTAIVYQKMILAIEAIEGTDLAMARAGSLSRRLGGVIGKSSKSSQDMRFDLPTVGMRTLETMAHAGIECLVIEAAHTLVVNPTDFIQKADELGLIVVAR